MCTLHKLDTCKYNTVGQLAQLRNNFRHSYERHIQKVVSRQPHNPRPDRTAVLIPPWAAHIMLKVVKKKAVIWSYQSFQLCTWMGWMSPQLSQWSHQFQQLCTRSNLHSFNWIRICQTDSFIAWKTNSKIWHHTMSTKAICTSNNRMN